MTFRNSRERRRFLYNSFSLVLLFTGAVRAQQQTTPNTPSAAQTTGTLGGIVMRDGTLEPIRDVEILIGGAAMLQLGSVPEQLARVKGSLKEAETDGNAERAAYLTQLVESLEKAAKGPKPVLTDKDGRFTVEGIDPGQHQVTARRQGYFSPDNPPPGEIAAPDAIGNATIILGQTTEITLTMVPGAAVSGRVSAANGKPVVGRVVEVLRRGVDLQGTSVLQRQSLSTTNDRGEYRVFDLPPGEYFIAASTDELISNSSGPSGTRTIVSTRAPGDPKTLYPSATNPEDALPIKLRPGELRTAVDIQLRAPAIAK